MTDQQQAESAAAIEETTLPENETTTEPAAPEPEPQGEPQEPQDTPEGEAEPEKPDGKRALEAEKRMREITRARYEAEAKAEKALQELEELRKKVAPPQQAKPAEGEPVLDQFEDWFEWNKAYNKWLARQEWQQLSAEQKQQADEQARAAAAAERDQRLKDNWAKRSAEGRRKFADFDEVVEPLAQMQDDSGFTAYIAESEVAEEIAYHLGRNLDDAYRLARLAKTDRVAMAREIGRLEARLQDVSSLPLKPKVTAAPKPAPIPGRREPGRLSPAELAASDATAYIRMMNAEDAKARAGG